MTIRRPLVAANWKMNGCFATISPLLDGIIQGVGPATTGDTEIAICAPYVYIPMVGDVLKGGGGIRLGAQNLSEHDAGAYTGEISAAMLADVDCRYVIVGHSERRNLYHESDHVIAKKFLMAGKYGLVPVLCLGEQLNEREAGITEDVISRQLNEVINLAGIKAFAGAVIAYEPVWAIGTGLTATPDQAEEVHGFLRL